MSKDHPTPNLGTDLVQYNLFPSMSYTTRSLVSQKGRTSREHIVPSLHPCARFHKFNSLLGSGKYPSLLVASCFKSQKQSLDNYLSNRLIFLFKDNIKGSSTFSCFFFLPGRALRREMWIGVLTSSFLQNPTSLHCLLQKPGGKGELPPLLSKVPSQANIWGPQCTCALNLEQTWMKIVYLQAAIPQTNLNMRAGSTKTFWMLFLKVHWISEAKLI